jgi:hypothetical protein
MRSLLIELEFPAGRKKLKLRHLIQFIKNGRIILSLYKPQISKPEKYYFKIRFRGLINKVFRIFKA